jgi:hypothetical protein
MIAAERSLVIVNSYFYPMARASCITKKIMYSSRELAEDALVELWMKNDYQPMQGPIAVYKCDDCGEFHHTSRPPMNEKLAKMLASDKMKIQKEANKWLEKFKHR